MRDFEIRMLGSSSVGWFHEGLTRRAVVLLLVLGFFLFGGDLRAATSRAPTGETLAEGDSEPLAAPRESLADLDPELEEAALADAIARIEERWGPLDPVSLAPPAVPDDENRAFLLRQAVEALEFKELHQFPGLEEAERDRLWEIISLEHRPIEGQDVGIVNALVGRNQRGLDLAASAMRRGRSNWGLVYEKGYVRELPPLIELGRLTQIALVRGLTEVLRGEAEIAIRDVELILATAESLENEPNFLIQLIRTRMVHYAMVLLRELIVRAHLDEGQLLSLGAALGTASEPEPIRLGLIAEMKGRYHHLIGVVEEEEDLRDLDGREGEDEETRRWRAGSARELRTFLEQMEEMIEYVERPLFEREEEIRGSLWDSRGESDLSIVREVVVLSESMFEDANTRGDLYAARLAVAEIALSLQRYRLWSGHFPKTLDELVPRFLPDLPVDPFTGAAPEYRRKGEGYLLRSKGDDCSFDERLIKDHVLRWEVSN